VTARERRRAWTLRGRLLLALLVLMAAGLTVFGWVSVAMLDRSLTGRIDDQLAAVALQMSSAGRPPLPPPPKLPVKINASDRLPTDFWVVFYSTAGHLTNHLGGASSEESLPVLPSMDLEAVRARGSEAVTVPDRSGTRQWRVRTSVQVPTAAQPVGGTVAVALSLDTTNATASRLRTIELAGGAVLLAALGLIGTWLVRLGLRPLTRIEQAAQAIAGGELDRRLPDDDPRTETGRLGAAFNVMLAHVASALKKREQSEDRLRLFVADASHELRTPLTSIRGFAELYRQSRQGAGDVDVGWLMERIEGGARQMSLLVDDLLLLAELDQERMLDFAEVDLAALGADAVRDALAGEPARRIEFAADAPVRVLGDVSRLRQVAANLVTNALVHTPPGTSIEVSVGHLPPAILEDATEGGCADEVVVRSGPRPPGSTGLVMLQVRDNGPGIPADSAAHVFDRFYRATPARGRTGGTGLGLAIVAAIVGTHGGCVLLRGTPGGGATFQVLLTSI
jgi:two-component system OmpR family sensor kinase